MTMMTRQMIFLDHIGSMTCFFLYNFEKVHQISICHGQIESDQVLALQDFKYRIFSG
jgi:hypothetical protein